MIKKVAATIATLLWAGSAWAQVDLNQATEIELDGLRGLGPSLTREVMVERKKNLFRDWKDVMQRVKGIGPQKAASLSAQGVRVNEQEFGPAPSRPPLKP